MDMGAHKGRLLNERNDTLEITKKNKIKLAIEYIVITGIIILALYLRIYAINTV